jgi:bacteriocin-like protein
MSNIKTSELNDNLNAVELTEAELNSVTGGASTIASEVDRLQMIIRMNEALAKMFKSIGDAVKGLS